MSQESVPKYFFYLIGIMINRNLNSKNVYIFEIVTIHFFG